MAAFALHLAKTLTTLHRGSRSRMGFSYTCKVQAIVAPEAVGEILSKLEGLWLVAAILRLEVPLPIRMAVAAPSSFNDMTAAPKQAKPFAFESAQQHWGVFHSSGAANPPISERNIDWLRTFYPVAVRLHAEERLRRAFGLYDQALWSRTLETAMSLLWTSLETLFDIGPHRDKTRAICRSLSDYVTDERSERDRAYQIVQKLCVERGRVVHAGHKLSEQDALQAFQFAIAAYRRVLIDGHLPPVFTP